MRQWSVRDVMTADVIAVSENTPYKDIAETLVRHRVSAVPVVAVTGEVLGVVSEADLLHKLDNSSLEPHLRFLERKQRRVARAKASADVARDLMSSPAVTIAATASVAAAAKLIDEEKVKRLPVVDEDGRLIGIVARSDLVRMYLRDDDEIRDEIIDQVLVHTLWIDPNIVSVSVERGVATLAGTVDRRSTRDLVVRLVFGVSGIVDVVDNLTYEYDDSKDLRRGGYLMRPAAEDITP